MLFTSIAGVFQVDIASQQSQDQKHLPLRAGYHFKTFPHIKPLLLFSDIFGVFCTFPSRLPCPGVIPILQNMRTIGTLINVGLLQDNAVQTNATAEIYGGQGSTQVDNMITSELALSTYFLRIPHHNLFRFCVTL